MNIDNFEQLARDVCDSLPDDFYKDLPGGVLLDPNIKYSPYAQGAADLIVMGEYVHSRYGNCVVIYYGSFERLCSHLSEEELKVQIKKVIKHEFRHHLEDLANMHGKDSLEYEDAVQLAGYLRRSKGRTVSVKQ